jgi:hypothetical protein
MTFGVASAESRLALLPWKKLYIVIIACLQLQMVAYNRREQAPGSVRFVNADDLYKWDSDLY